MDVRLVQDPLRPAKEASVESALEALAKDVRQRLADTATRAAELRDDDERFWKRLVDVLTVRHEEALDLLYEATGAQPADAWNRVRSYHARTIRSLWPEIEACFEHFTETPPPCRVWTDAVESLEGFCDTLPARLEAWLDPAVYAPDEDASLYETARKLGTRLRLWSRETKTRIQNGYRDARGKDDLPLPGTTRPVPVRDIVQYHACVRLAGAVEAHVLEGEELRRRRAMQLASICAQWNRAVLDAETQLAHVQTDVTELDEPQVAAWRDARRAARKLQEQIEALSELSLPEHVDDDLLAGIDEELRDDLARGGTYLLPDRRIHRGNRASSGLFEAASETTRRLDQLGARLKLEEITFEMREAVVSHRRGLLDRMAHLSMTPVRKTFTSMRLQIEHAEEMLRDSTDAPEALMQALDRIRGQLARGLESALSSLPGIATAGISAALPEGVDERRTQAAGLPSRMIVAGDPEEDGAPATGRSRTIDVKERALRAFDDTINERLRRDAELFRTELLGLWNDAEQATQIIHYNLNTAQEELARRIGGAAGDVPIKSLAAEGLELASETIAQLEDRLPPLWMSYEAAVIALTQAYWLQFVRDVNDDVSVHSRVAGMRSRLSRRAEDLVRRSREQDDSRRNGFSRFAGEARTRMRLLARSGSDTTPAIATEESDAHAVIDVVTGVDSLFEELPFVYRRLFSFDPVSDPSLLEGSESDLATLDQHYDRWRRGRTSSPINFLFDPGTGRTSFLNIAQSHLEDRKLHVGRVPLSDRVRSEAELVDQLLAALQLESSATTLDAIADQIVDSTAPPKACLIIDNLEALMLQAPGGMHLIEGFFQFAARTDSRILFVTATSAAAWSFMEKSLKSAALSVAYQSSAITSESLEAIILNRHRRSGLRLQFAEPAAPRPALRQRLRRAGSEEERQKCLHEDYFGRLFNASHGNIRLAILHWIRSIRIDSGVTVRDLVPLNFNFLQSLNLDSLFTLRAVLLHRSVDASELAAINRIPEDVAASRLAALHDRRLIEPVENDRPDAGKSYRVVPLLQQPVSEALREHNML